MLHNYHAILQFYEDELSDNNTAQQLPCKTLPCKGMTTGKISCLPHGACREKLRLDRFILQHECPVCIFLVQHIIDRIAHICSQGALGLVQFRLSTLYTENLVNLTVS